MSRSQTVKRKHLDAAEAGFHPGNYPLGYIPASDYTAPHVPDPITAPAVIAAFRLRAGGYSLGEICRMLTTIGLRSARGKEISRQAMHGILTNPFYMGLVRLNGRLYPGQHQPLISAELFAAVQATLHSTGGGVGMAQAGGAEPSLSSAKQESKTTSAVLGIPE